MATVPGWLTARVVEPCALPLEVPKRRVPIIYMLARIYVSGLLLLFSLVGAYATTIDKSWGDAILGLILFTLGLLFFYFSSPDVQFLQLDQSGFTYSKISRKRVAWQDVVKITPGAVFRDIFGLVLVSRKGQPRPLSISGYFDVTREDLATAMTALAAADTTGRAA